MPMYDHELCPWCGNTESFAKLQDTVDVPGGPRPGLYIPCETPNCVGVNRTVPHTFAVGGLTPIAVPHINRVFKSASALDQHLKVNNLDIHSPGSQSYRNIKDEARADADTMFRQMGFSDKEDFRRQHKKDPGLKREMAKEAQKALPSTNA